MPSISENALMMAIQALHQTMAHLSAARETTTGTAQADIDEMLEAYEIAAVELRTVYETACAQGADLPAYTSLTPLLP